MGEPPDIPRSDPQYVRIGDGHATTILDNAFTVRRRFPHQGFFRGRALMDSRMGPRFRGVCKNGVETTERCNDNETGNQKANPHNDLPHTFIPDLDPKSLPRGAWMAVVRWGMGRHDVLLSNLMKIRL